MNIPTTFFIFFFLLPIVLLLSAEEITYQYHPRCEPFMCGKLGKITFPFRNITHPDCGLYTINCSEPFQKIQLKDGGHWYPINSPISIDNKELTKDLDSQICESIESFTLPHPSKISHVFTSNSLTLFNCSLSVHFTSPRNYIHIGCLGYNIYYPLLNDSSQHRKTSHFPPECSMFHLPVGHLQVYVNNDCINCFYVNGGQCKTDNRNQFYCSNPRKRKCRGDRRLGLKLGLGIGCPVFVLCPLIFLLWRSYKKAHSSSNTISRNSCDRYSNSDLEGGSYYLGIPVFSYHDLEEATHNFDSKRELGDGGFGTVYYGILKDGREVAVKRLYEHNCKRLQQFMNEIVILTRLHHKNLVSLYGCTSRHSRELLLVYEYIPNGTVADHLHGDRAKIGSLTWSIRMRIAIETATALRYLHASDIIHRDIKTNNILLDSNFNVKVADFGLSRLFPNDVTHISTAPQGTPGYVDPSYHQCYQLTSKSDVYSFGVVLVELISSMPAVDITRHSHEISLANLAINKIQTSAINEMIDPSLGFETDNEVRRKIIAFSELAFQCLHQDKEVRPSMEKVLEDLKRIQSGKNESDTENEEEPYDDFEVKENVPPPPSPDCDEISLLKNIKPPTSPISVTQNWPSISTTPNVSS